MRNTKRENIQKLRIEIAIIGIANQIPKRSTVLPSREFQQNCLFNFANSGAHTASLGPKFPIITFPPYKVDNSTDDKLEETSRILNMKSKAFYIIISLIQVGPEQEFLKSRDTTDESIISIIAFEINMISTFRPLIT